jgi:hypothetical protein
MVKISSFDECELRYDAHNAGRYLRERHILGMDKGIVSLKN